MSSGTAELISIPVNFIVGLIESELSGLLMRGRLWTRMSEGRVKLVDCEEAVRLDCAC